jgi:hypothetical protein
MSNIRSVIEFQHRDFSQAIGEYMIGANLEGCGCSDSGCLMLCRFWRPGAIAQQLSE